MHSSVQCIIIIFYYILYIHSLAYQILFIILTQITFDMHYFNNTKVTKLL